MTDSNQRRRGGAVLMFFRWAAPFIVVAGGVLGALYFVRTAPQATQRPAKPSAVMVTARTVQPSSEQVVIETMGTVIAARQIVLQPRVSGVIEEQHQALVPGGRIAAGETLVKIDAADYEIACKQAEAALARAEAQLMSAELEEGRVIELNTRQATTKKELDNVRTTLAAAEADVAAARAALERSRLDLSRTTLTAPFACVVVLENVDLGALVTPQTQLATLVGTDEYWVRVAVPVSQLRWIHIPAAENEIGAPVLISQRLGGEAPAQWSGHVVRLLGDLEPQGRMARLLVSAPRPLGDADTPDDHPPLLLGSYVDVQIESRKLKDVFALERDELRDGAAVWIMDEQDLLDIRPVDIAFRSRDLIFVSGGLRPGERLITSDLPAPVADMQLRLAGDESDNATAGAEGEGGGADL